MLRRVWALWRARFQATSDGGLPWAAISMQILVAGVLCGVVSDALPPFSYACFAFAVSAALLCVPLFGEAGELLWADEGREWAEALPARPLEHRLARRLHALFELAALSLGSIGVAACFAPAELGAPGRLLFMALGVAQAIALGSALLAVLTVLGGRLDALLVGLQTALFAGLVVGGALGLRLVPELMEFDSLAALPSSARALPPVWFAAALSPGAGSGALWPAIAFLVTAVAVLFAAPDAARNRQAKRTDALGRVLGPLRRLAARTWVRTDERASFELVFDGLPREREFALRTYPLFGIPLAFLVAGASDTNGPAREAVFALLLFAPSAYMPILLTQVPASRSFRARWILDLAPIDSTAIHNGAIKALAIRFLLPLYALLVLLCAARGGLDVALRLGLPATLAAIVLMRGAYRSVVVEPPLSTSPEELGTGDHVFGLMLGTGMAAAIAAVAAAKLITTPIAGLTVTAALLVVELVCDRAARRAPARRVEETA